MKVELTLLFLFLISICGALYVREDPPPGHPFTDMAKMSLLVQYLQVMRDLRTPQWPAGVPEPIALWAAANILGMPEWTPAMGTSPIIARMP